MIDYPEVLQFWFEELQPAQWFSRDDSVDNKISEKFSALHEQACEQGLPAWRDSAGGRLAEILVLDQFSRNLFRDDRRAFACDELAVRLCREAVEACLDKELTKEQKAFLYMPLMHSEKIEDHELAVELFAEPGLENNLDFENRHRDIILRFGRYPHRNAALGRESTADELVFLQQPGSSF